VELKDITRAGFAEAVRIYMEEAYGDAPPPEAVRQRLAWPAGESLAQIAAAAVFERTPPDAPPAACSRIRLRLGNRRYPHMKLGADAVPGTPDWVLAVDCHDAQLAALAASESERAALATMVRENAALKARIEKRWAEAGLPTFERYIRARLLKRGPGAA